VHLHLKRVPRRLLRLLAPERVDQPVARDDLVRVQQQAGEERRLPTLSEPDGTACVDDFERSENAKLRCLHLLDIAPSSA